jgi:hypothetical protein
MMGMNLLLLIWLSLFGGIEPNFPPPPGTYKVSSNLCIDKRPVTYLDYYEFRAFVKKNKPNLLSTIIPVDTSISYEDEILWDNPKFHDFPVLGLDIQQITMYCEWRSSAVNKIIDHPDIRCGDFNYWMKFDNLDPNKKFNVVYSLPSINTIENYCKSTKSRDVDEMLVDGICYAKKSGKIKALNRSNLFSFRCVAEYKVKS